ncbi:hypothetical protein CGP82_01085 [Campylobacter sp. LR185c]|nr:hypothetical protein CGP82_01085 [Campylobacter sp. LR185c]
MLGNLRNITKKIDFIISNKILTEKIDVRSHDDIRFITKPINTFIDYTRNIISQTSKQTSENLKISDSFMNISKNLSDNTSISDKNKNLGELNQKAVQTNVNHSQQTKAHLEMVISDSKITEQIIDSIYDNIQDSTRNH